MYVWRHIPLLRFIIPFVIGILLADNFNISFPGILLCFLAQCLVLGVGHYYLKKLVKPRLIFGLSLVAVFTLLAAGMLVTTNYKLNTFSTFFGNHTEYDFVLARVCDNPTEKERSISCEVSLNKCFVGDSSFDVLGNAQVYFEKDTHSRSLNYGDYVLLNNSLKPIEEIKNPHQFDFKNYYSHKNVFHQGYIKSGNWSFTGSNKSYLLFQLSYLWQKKLKSHFENYFSDDAIKGVAQAIVFGYKEDLDEDWMQAFSKTGTIHVLAVSGLHVGIIFILLSALLRLKTSRGRWLIVKSILIIFFLFLYCLVTGFAPSVSRAALMFSIVICAKAWKRNSNIYNTLTFAAFVLLIFNPLNIYNVGFQFSFSAVIGIVYYKDFFRSLWPQSSYIGDKIVTLLAVSISAQITTFPIGLFYFHQYPNLFMFSNLIVIPCITVILYAGIFFVIFGSWIDAVAKLCAKVVNIYIDFIARVVLYIQDVPYAFFEHVHITLSQMLLIYAFIILSTYTLVNKWKAGFVYCIVLVIGFISVDYIYSKSMDKTEVICFDIYNEILVGFRKNGHITFLASEGVYADKSKLEFVIQPYITIERLTDNYSIFPINSISANVNLKNVRLLSNGYVWFDNKSFLFLDQLNGYIDKDLSGDFLIIGKSKTMRYLDKVASKLDFGSTVVLNSWCTNAQIKCINSHFSVSPHQGYVLLH